MDQAKHTFQQNDDVRNSDQDYRMRVRAVLLLKPFIILFWFLSIKKRWNRCYRYMESTCWLWNMDQINYHTIRHLLGNIDFSLGTKCIFIGEKKFLKYSDFEVICIYPWIKALISLFISKFKCMLDFLVERVKFQLLQNNCNKLLLTPNLSDLRFVESNHIFLWSQIFIFFFVPGKMHPWTNSTLSNIVASIRKLSISQGGN